MPCDYVICASNQESPNKMSNGLASWPEWRRTCYTVAQAASMCTFKSRCYRQTYLFGSILITVVITFLVPDRSSKQWDWRQSTNSARIRMKPKPRTKVPYPPQQTLVNRIFSLSSEISFMVSTIGGDIFKIPISSYRDWKNRGEYERWPPQTCSPR